MIEPNLSPLPNPVHNLPGVSDSMDKLSKISHETLENAPQTNSKPLSLRRVKSDPDIYGVLDRLPFNKIHKNDMHHAKNEINDYLQDHGTNIIKRSSYRPFSEDIAELS